MFEDDETVDFENVDCQHSTDKAILCVIDGQKYWIPLSQIAVESEVKTVGDFGTLTITEWIAQQKGLV